MPKNLLDLNSERKVQMRTFHEIEPDPHGGNEPKHAHKEIWENNPLFHATFSRAGIGMAIVGLDGRIVAGNPALQGVLGYEAGELAGRVFTEITHPEDVPEASEFSKELFSGKRESYHAHRRYIMKNGGVLWGRLTVFLVRNEKGEPYFIVAMLQDITENKRVESALRDSEERFRLFMSNSPTIAWIKDDQGRYIYISKAAEERYNIGVHKVLGRTDSRLFPETAETFEANDLSVMRAGHALQFTEEVVEPDGTRSYWLNSKFPFKDAAGRCFVAGIGLDITEKTLNEQALHASERRFRELADMLPEGVVETDADMRLTFANQQAYTMFGYSLQEFERGLNAYHMVVAEDRAKAVENVSKIMHGGSSGLNEYRGLRKDGSVFPILIRTTPIISQGKIKGLRGIIVDITERKKLEEDMQQVQKMESLGKLAGGIAHDFNNILTSILGRSELLLGLLPAGTHEHQSVQAILEAGRRGSDLVRQILAFSRQSENKPRAVRTDTVLQEALKFARSTIPANIEICADIQGGGGWIMADPMQFERIAMNLITNAYHAIEPCGGKISVHLDEVEVGRDLPLLSLAPGRYARLSVADDGCGIDPIQLDKIFDPYFTTKEPGKGTGLGLSVVYGIVASYQGDIKVHTELGKGTTFEVFLPLLEKPPHSMPLQEPSACPTGKGRILLVDDEEQIVQLEKLILEKLGYDVSSFISSVEALEAFQANPHLFDLVITDMTMPQMTGDRLAGALKAIRPAIPVVICTGYSDRLTVERVQEAKIQGVLMKPFDVSAMAQAVRKALDEAE